MVPRNNYIAHSISGNASEILPEFVLKVLEYK